MLLLNKWSQSRSEAEFAADLQNAESGSAAAETGDPGCITDSLHGRTTACCRCRNIVPPRSEHSYDSRLVVDRSDTWSALYAAMAVRQYHEILSDSLGR